MSITENKLRVGNFTSSSIWRLMKNGKSAGTLGDQAESYIAEKNLERRFGISLQQEKYSRPTAWGHFLEKRVHKLLGVAYESVGHITVPHPTVAFWKGSPDNKNVTASICGDTKCFERLAFGSYIKVLEDAKGDTEHFKKHNEKEYWQLVSNAIILDMNYIEPILYMPFESEMEEIRQMAYDYEGSDMWKYRFIYESPLCELPYLKDDGYYNNLNRFIFEVPLEDKEALHNRVIRCGSKLDPFVTVDRKILR